MARRPRLDARTVRLLGLGARADVELSPRPKRAKPAAQVERRVPRDTRVLGLDLASDVSGWAVVEGGRLLAAGSIKLPTAARVGEGRVGLLRRRYDELARDVGALVAAHRPAVVAYEYPDVARPHWSGGTKGREFLVARALGAVEMALADCTRDLPVVLIGVPVSAAKRQLTGSAGATKGRVRLTLEHTLGRRLDELTDDMTDAISVALAVYEEE